MSKKLSKLVDKSRYSKNISYRLKNKRKGDFLTSREKVDFLLDINRIPTINKKFIDKAKDQINSGGNLTRIVICELNKRKYIADGQHRYIIGKAFNLPILVERYKVTVFNVMFPRLFILVKEDIPETREKKTSGMINIFKRLINIEPPRLKIYISRKLFKDSGKKST